MQKIAFISLITIISLSFIKTSQGQGIIMGSAPLYGGIVDQENFYDPGGTHGFMGDNQDPNGYFAINLSDTMTLKTGIQNSQLYIIFNEFAMGYGDTLYIYDGENVQSPLIGFYNSVRSPGEITATGRSLTFVFHSDSIMDVRELSTGWEAHTYAYLSDPTDCILTMDNNGYTWTTCNAQFYDSGGPTGNIAANNQTIHAEFVSPVGTHIKMEFSQFSVNGIMKIYDGFYVDPDKRLIGQFCPSTSTPPVLFSSGTALAVEYVGAVSDVNKPGWAAEISCVPDLFESPDGSACPEVNIMTSDPTEVLITVDTIEFDCAEPVIILNADIVATGTYSNDYTIKSIPFAPIFEFDEGTSVGASSDDSWQPSVDLPFTFALFGESYNKVYPSTNGLVSFSPQSGYCQWSTNAPPAAPPYTSIPYNYKNCIYVIYEDTDPRYYLPGGDIKYGILGAFPCRAFVFNFKGVGLFSCWSSGNNYYNTYQLAFYEGTNIIDIFIQHRACCSSWNGGHGVIGLQNNNSAQILTVPGRDFSSQWTANNEAWRFTPITPMDPDATITWYKNMIHPDSIVGYDKKMVVSPQITTHYIIEYHYTNAAGDSFDLLDTVLVHVPIPKVTATHSVGSQTNNVSCPGESVTLNLEIDTVDEYGIDAIGFQWSCGDTTRSCIVAPDTTTEYTVEITFSNHCKTTTSITVEVEDLEFPVITGNDHICKGASTSLTAEHPSNNFHWKNTGENTPSITVAPPDTTDYIVEVTSTEGNCKTTDTFRVYVWPNPSANFYAIPTDIYVENGTGTVTCTNTTTPECDNLTWNFGDIYSAENVVTGIETPTHDYTRPGHYIIKLNVVDTNGCTDSTFAHVTVIVPFFFYVPNSFTPNGDGINEYFAPKGEGVAPEHYTMLIYDRTGQLVFKTNNPTDYWDGRAKNGKMCETGVYVYLIRLKTMNGDDKEYTGSISLIK